MFEHYLVQQVPDRRRRLRMLVAVHLAALTTAGGMGFTWLMGKLQIAQVAPPNANFVLVQMTLDSPLPPPPLPPAPARTEPEDKAPEEPEPDDEPPEDVTELLPPPKPRPGPVGNGAPTATGAAPIGVPGAGIGIPGVTRVPLNFPTGVATARQPKPEQRAPVPLAVVRAQSVYTPNPDQDRLAATRAGMFDKRPGENETAFCVDAGGRTTEVRTVKAFPGDPAVDEVIRSTIKTWRFRPFMVEGKAIKTCTSQVFRITFK